jgi:hypothetical protein
VAERERAGKSVSRYLRLCAARQALSTSIIQTIDPVSIFGDVKFAKTEQGHTRWQYNIELHPTASVTKVS